MNPVKLFKQKKMEQALTCYPSLKETVQPECHDILERMNAPARAIASRPAVSC